MKKLFFTNLVPIIEFEGLYYKLAGELEIDVGNEWDGYVKGYIRKSNLEISTDECFLGN